MLCPCPVPSAVLTRVTLNEASTHQQTHEEMAQGLSEANSKICYAFFLKPPNTGPLPPCAPILPCWQPVTRTRTGITWSFLCHSKGNLILCCSVHQTSLCFPVLQVQTKMSSKIMQVASYAWIHTEYPQCFNYSQAEAHRIVSTTEEGLLPPELIRQDGNKDPDLLENGLEDMGRGKGKVGRSERVAWTYIHYQA